MNSAYNITFLKRFSIEIKIIQFYVKIKKKEERKTETKSKFLHKRIKIYIFMDIFLIFFCDIEIFPFSHKRKLFVK